MCTEGGGHQEGPGLVATRKISCKHKNIITMIHKSQSKVIVIKIVNVSYTHLDKNVRPSINS